MDSEEVYGLVNFGVGISSKFIFNEEYNFPIIELKVFSGSKEVLYLKLPSSIVYSYANLLQTTVKFVISELQAKASLREFAGVHDVPDAKEVYRLLSRFTVDQYKEENTAVKDYFKGI